MFIIVAALSLAAAGAHAGEDAPSRAADLIKQATAAYTAVKYDQALPLLAEAERQPNLGNADRISILKYRAFIRIVEGKDILARGAVTSIYRIDPEFALPQTVSPKFRRFFADVRRDFTPQPRTVEEARRGHPAAPGTLTGTVPAPPNISSASGRRGHASPWNRAHHPGTIIGLDVKSAATSWKRRPGRGRPPGFHDPQERAVDPGQGGPEGARLDDPPRRQRGCVAAGGALFFLYDAGKDVPSRPPSAGSDGRSHVVAAAWTF